MPRARNTGGPSPKVQPQQAWQGEAAADEPRSRKGETWWKVPRGGDGETKKKLASLVTEAARTLRETPYEQRRLAMWQSNIQMFNDDPDGVYTLAPTQYFTALSKDQRVSRNVVRATVEAAQAMICASKVRPFFQTFDGTYNSRQKAEGLNRWMAGVFHENRVPKLAETVMRDAMIGDVGFFRITEKPVVLADDQARIRKAVKAGEELPEVPIKHRVLVERAFPWDVMIPTAEVMRGWHQWRLLYEPKHWDRASTVARWVDSRSDRDFEAHGGSDRETLRKAIESADAWDGTNSIWPIDEMGKDLIEVFEVWKGPSFEGAADGRHVLVVGDAVVFDVPWWHWQLPFVGVVWRADTMGVLGRGIVDGVRGKQQLVNMMNKSIDKNIRLLAAPKWAVKEGSKVKPAHLGDNRPGVQVNYVDTPPTPLTIQPVPQEVFMRLRDVIQSAFEDEGISQAIAEASKPPDVESGLAIRRVVEVGKRRLALQQGGYDDMHIELAYGVIDRAQEILEDEGSYPVKAYGSLSGDASLVDLKDVMLSRDAMTIRCAPSNALSDVPGERVADVEAYQRIGLMKDPQTLADQFGFMPDLEASLDLVRSPKLAIEKQLDDVVEGRGYPDNPTVFDENMNKALAMQLAVERWNFLARFNDTEDSRQRISDYMQSIVNVDKLPSTAAPQPPGPMPGAPPPGMPGAPGAPPPVAPMPMAPPPGLTPPPQMPAPPA